MYTVDEGVSRILKIFRNSHTAPAVPILYTKTDDSVSSQNPEMEPL